MIVEFNKEAKLLKKIQAEIKLQTKNYGIKEKPQR